MAHGITLALRNIQPPDPEWVHQHLPGEGLFGAPPKPEPYRNPARDKKKSTRLRADAPYSAPRGTSAPARKPNPDHVPRWNARPRLVLIPGKRKVAPSPWRDRLLASRQGGEASR